MFSKIHIIHTVFIYLYKSFTTLDKAWERTSKNRRDGEIGKQAKLNGSAEYEIEKVKQTR